MMAFVGLMMICCSCFVGNAGLVSAESTNDQTMKEENLKTRYKIDTITLGTGIKPLLPHSDGKPEFVRIHDTTTVSSPVLHWYNNGKN